MSAQTRPPLLHGSCVAQGGQGVLLRGPSGSGKSDLALRLIDGGARLVADDYVQLERRGDLLWAAPPAQIAGLIEIRGAGVVAMSAHDEAPLRLIIDLVSPALVERLPEPAAENVLGLSVPCFLLAPFEASAPAKIRAILHAIVTGGFRADVKRP